MTEIMTKNATSSLWSDEYDVFSDGDGDYAYRDTKIASIIDSIINIMRTLLVCVLLAGSSFYFNKDATNLVLTPIEWMLEKIQIISKNPMKLCGDSEELMGILELEQKKKEWKKWKKLVDFSKIKWCNKYLINHKKISYETEIIETSLSKLGNLLSLCFGMAGA